MEGNCKGDWRLRESEAFLSSGHYRVNGGSGKKKDQKNEPGGMVKALLRKTQL